MTNPFTMLPVLIQSISTLNITVTRIKDFLILPELKEEVKQEPEDKNDAISVENGTFKWKCEYFISISLIIRKINK
jgi:ABC-type bacteriocin/lantibiotic exporter with double-glycine peptidase domain